jgi:hypothetical protein
MLRAAPALQRQLARRPAGLSHLRRSGADRYRAAGGVRIAVAGYIAPCAIVSIVSTATMPDNTNREISEDNDNS